ncbi:MAG: DUF4494 domain-containing protein [Flavobacteriales bacterium]|nr:DUF4494 domain-containing protein [Flavobacteriales bacterium]MDG1780328.1 DUF4494 domain-containing protein [Flavobacteriales bacterium]MDG2246934.1 DUF4494 domain-containing protein [Flavobacteriales bacterium]
MKKDWFTCKVRHVKVDEHGHENKVTEQYVLDAYNYTEAEARMLYLLEGMGNGPFEVQQITKSNYQEVIRFEDADLWFKVKVSFVSFDEESGKEKSSNQYFLVSSIDVKDAYERVTEFLSSSISSCVIPAVTYTKIIDVYPLSEEDPGMRTARERGLTSLGNVPGMPAPPVTEGLSQNEDVPENVDEETGEVY